MSRGRRYVRALIMISAAGLLAWSGWSACTTFLAPDATLLSVDNHVAATDSRVCRGSWGNNVSFDEVMSYFRLKLPPQAQHVVFTANLNPLLGEYSLNLRFTTTPGELRLFLSAAGLPPASPGTQPRLDFGEFACGLQPPDGPRMAYTQDPEDSPMGSSPRAVAADPANRREVALCHRNGPVTDLEESWNHGSL
jgi:hypothetical protein